MPKLLSTTAEFSRDLYATTGDILWGGEQNWFSIWEVIFLLQVQPSVFQETQVLSMDQYFYLSQKDVISLYRFVSERFIWGPL